MPAFFKRTPSQLIVVILFVCYPGNLKTHPACQSIDVTMIMVWTLWGQLRHVPHIGRFHVTQLLRLRYSDWCDTNSLCPVVSVIAQTLQMVCDQESAADMLQGGNHIAQQQSFALA